MLMARRPWVVAGSRRFVSVQQVYVCGFESRRPRRSESSGPATENLKTRCRLGDRLRANSGIGRHAGSNRRKTCLDFRVTRERYSSTSNLASRAELFGIGTSNDAEVNVGIHVEYEYTEGTADLDEKFNAFTKGRLSEIEGFAALDQLNRYEIRFPKPPEVK